MRSITHSICRLAPARVAAPLAAVPVPVPVPGASGCAWSSVDAAGGSAERRAIDGSSVGSLADGTTFLLAGPSNGNRMTAIVRGP